MKMNGSAAICVVPDGKYQGPRRRLSRCRRRAPTPLAICRLPPRFDTSARVTMDSGAEPRIWKVVENARYEGIGRPNASIRGGPHRAVGSRSFAPSRIGWQSASVTPSVHGRFAAPRQANAKTRMPRSILPKFGSHGRTGRASRLFERLPLHEKINR